GLPRLPPARRGGGARGRRPGTLLHRAANVGVGRGAGPQAHGGPAPGRDSPVRGAVLPGARRPGNLRWPPPARSRACAALRGARRGLGLDPGRPVLGLFPGSRPQEVVRLWPVFRDTAAAVLASHPATQVVVAGTPRGRYDGPGAIRIHMGDPLSVFAAASAGRCTSGTTTLEAALVDLPMVIAYRLNPVSFAIAIRLLRVPHVGLVNLI